MLNKKEWNVISCDDCTETCQLTFQSTSTLFLALVNWLFWFLWPVTWLFWFSLTAFPQSCLSSDSYLFSVETLKTHLLSTKERTDTSCFAYFCTDEEYASVVRKFIRIHVFAVFSRSAPQVQFRSGLKCHRWICSCLVGIAPHRQWIFLWLSWVVFALVSLPTGFRSSSDSMIILQLVWIHMFVSLYVTLHQCVHVSFTVSGHIFTWTQVNVLLL